MLFGLESRLAEMNRRGRKNRYLVNFFTRVFTVKTTSSRSYASHQNVFRAAPLLASAAVFLYASRCCTRSKNPNPITIEPMTNHEPVMTSPIGKMSRFTPGSTKATVPLARPVTTWSTVI